MKVVTYNDNSIAAMREEISYENNGNVLIGNNTSIGFWLVKGVYDVEEIPSEVEENKYCYDEEVGFYKNENYEEPVDPNKIEERISALEDVINISLGF